MAGLKLADIRCQTQALQSAEHFFDSVVPFALFELGVLRELAPGPRAFRAR